MADNLVINTNTEALDSLSEALPVFSLYIENANAALAQAAATLALSTDSTTMKNISLMVANVNDIVKGSENDLTALKQRVDDYSTALKNIKAIMGGNAGNGTNP